MSLPLIILRINFFVPCSTMLLFAQIEKFLKNRTNVKNLVGFTDQKIVGKKFCLMCINKNIHFLSCINFCSAPLHLESPNNHKIEISLHSELSFSESDTCSRILYHQNRVNSATISSTQISTDVVYIECYRNL